METTEGHPHAIAQQRLFFMAAAAGRLGLADEAYRRAEATAERTGHAADVHTAAFGKARLDLLLLHDTAAALDRVRDVLARHPLETVRPEQRRYFDLASLLTYAGRALEARELLREEREARDSGWQPDWRARHRSCVRALMALTEGGAEEAISALEPLAGTPGWGACPRAIPVRPVLGQAYLAADRPDSAMTHLEGYLARPSSYRVGWDAAYLPGVLERLAGLYAARSRPAEAVYTYTRLVELWEHSDPPLQPRVREARQRVRELRTGIRGR